MVSIAGGKQSAAVTVSRADNVEKIRGSNVQERGTAAGPPPRDPKLDAVNPRDCRSQKTNRKKLTSQEPMRLPQSPTIANCTKQKVISKTILCHCTNGMRIVNN